MRPKSNRNKVMFNCFKSGRMSVKSEAHFGRPSASRNKEVIEKVCQIVMEDRRLKFRKIFEEMEISTELVHSILTEDLCMRKESANHSQAADGATKTAPCGNCPGHSGLRKH